MKKEDQGQEQEQEAKAEPAPLFLSVPASPRVSAFPFFPMFFPTGLCNWGW